MLMLRRTLVLWVFLLPLKTLKLAGEAEQISSSSFLLVIRKTHEQ
jgi:hypothetical protein